jgi:2-C-methyl-D-erythritol 4-phosphate cytidylyltransferase/2-C-methyl-D-erythritol 2,4-cyclodiphosphate synthase
MADGKTIALVVAAGSGSRAGGDPKQFRQLAGRSVLAHAVSALAHPRIDAIRAVIGEGQEDRYRSAIGEVSLSAPILGGATRQQSVRNGLEALAADGGVGRVLIHDAARPFVPAAVIDRLLDRLDRHPGAVPVLPMADSLAVAGDALGDPVAREALVRVQTPQAFRFDAILSAHRSWSSIEPATDDAQVLRAAGLEVATVAGAATLDKLTFEEDLARAADALEARMRSRTGLGFDVHRFGEGDRLWLGGVEIGSARALSGHSDADVVLHALTDALLATVAAGDIGDHFPDSDPQWRGAASARFVEHALDLIGRRGGRVDHVDVTIICEEPRIAPHKHFIRERIAGLLRLPIDAVSVKATTTERLGFTGRGEGIAAQAIATVRIPEQP